MGWAMVQVNGTVTLFGYDGYGRLNYYQKIKNLLTDVGLAHIADQMSERNEAAMSHIAVGEDDIPAAIGQTALGDEIVRVALGSKVRTDTTVIYIATFGPGVGTGALREAGIFNNALGGTMLNRATFVYDKTLPSTLIIQWELSLAGT